MLILKRNKVLRQWHKIHKKTWTIVSPCLWWVESSLGICPRLVLGNFRPFSRPQLTWSAFIWVHKVGGGRCVNSFHEVLWLKIWRWYELCFVLKPSLLSWEEETRHIICVFLGVEQLLIYYSGGCCVLANTYFGSMSLLLRTLWMRKYATFKSFLNTWRKGRGKKGAKHLLSSRYLVFLGWRSYKIGSWTVHILQVRK